jgi:hypothetical protein
VSDSKTPFKIEKRDVHLLIDPAVFRMAKVECAKMDCDLSYAAEQLFRLWSQGKVQIKPQE